MGNILSCIKRSEALLSTFKSEVKIALEVLHGKRAASRVEAGILRLFPSRGRKFGVPLVLSRGLQETSPLASGKSSFHSNWEGEQGMALESLMGNWASSCMEE